MYSEPGGESQATSSARASVPSARRRSKPPHCRASEAAGLAALSDRERTVCELTADGAPYPAIAARLKITSSTVKTHGAHAKARLGLGGRENLGAAYRRLTRG